METKACRTTSDQCDSEGSDQSADRLEEDDIMTFVGSPSLACNSESKSNGEGLYLNTNLARDSSRTLREDLHEHADDVPRVQVGLVTIIFDLPDGSQADQQFQLGQTVEVLKSFVESEFGIPMSSQELHLGSIVMMDPMSLLDYSEIDGEKDILIVVEGEMCEESKK
ncbi:unnamed protein product [Scytosiphon promiscuus]